HLQRHHRPPPGPADRLVRGRDQLGRLGAAGRRAHARLLPAHARPSPRPRHPALLGQPHARLVHGGPARPDAGRPHRRRPGDVVLGLPAQREHLRLLGEVPRRGRRGARPGGRGQGGQHQRPGLPRPDRTGIAMTAFAASRTSTSYLIPDVPDRARMRRETGARLRAAMAAQGVDALVLLNNANVVYATGANWPLGDAGLAHVERPVAVVLAGDPHPHLFLPFREGAAAESDLPDDHLHGPVYLEFDEGVTGFARALADLIPAGSTVAVDEHTGAMLRAGAAVFPPGPPADAAAVIGAANVVETPDEVSCTRTAARITEQAIVDVQAALAPGRRQIDLSAGFVRRAFELGATATMLDAIWQVMPDSRAEGVWT